MIKKEITVKELIRWLKKCENQNAIVFMPIDPEQNGFHTVDPHTPVSYGIERLKEISKDFDFEKDYIERKDFVIINSWEYKDDNFK